MAAPDRPMPKRTYTGTKDGAAKAKRPGTELFQSLLCKRFDSKNLGTWVVRDMRGKPGQLSVHATGRAGDTMPKNRKSALEIVAWLDAIPADVKPAIDQLVYAINPFISATRNALARRLTWANFASVKRTVKVRSDSFPLTVVLKDLPGSPDGVFVLQCYDATDRVPALAPRLALADVPGVQFDHQSERFLGQR